MLRLIAVGVVVTCSLLIAAPVPKPTERELKARWGEIVKGAEEDRGLFDRGCLKLVASHRKVDLLGLNPLDDLSVAPHTVRCVDGDFEVSVALKTVTVLKSAGGAKDQYEWAVGLYARDGATFVANRVKHELRKCDNFRMHCDWHGPGKTGGGGLSTVFHTPTDGPIHFRLKRADGVLYASVSPDGLQWSDACVLAVGRNPVLLADDVEVGVFAAPELRRTIEATFSDFKLTTGKK